MTHNRRQAAKLTFGFVCIFLFLVIGGSIQAQTGNAKNGETLFKGNCTSCHAMEKEVTGPALMGAVARWPDKGELHKWIKHNGGVIAEKYPYALALVEKYKTKGAMTDFAGTLKDQDVTDIIAYIEGYTPPPPPPPGTTQENNGGDNTLLFGILTMVLAVVAFVLLQVNANLKKLADDKAGERAEEPVSFWRNKAYIAFVTIIVFLIGGYFMASGAIGLGRTQNFEPKQPIFYSHKVHAGVNQINCMYCHIGTYQGKQATIPSVNVCMNCHTAIQEYSGAKLYTAEGEEVDGTAQIKKLYEYAGYTPGQNWDAKNAKPIEWVRIHNLPDHVYFNHSQHVVAGKVQCQTCHGEITKMDEVYQFAPLSMGWCVNCHRTTKVNFKDNGFYSIYEKYQHNIDNHTMDSVTVENIGGTECQKCHY